MNFKRFIAFTISATMVLGNCVTAFADDGVTGAGVVEYDDSTAVVYDKVTVPQLTASKYNFEIDPTGLLNEFDADQYAEGSVYFSSVSTPASLVPNAEKLGTDKLYTASKAVYAKESGKNYWKGVVKTAETDSSTKVITVSALEDGFYVWTPVSTAATGYTNGKNGEWTALAASNFAQWFDVAQDETDGYVLTLKNDAKSGTYVCDGNIYNIAYTEIAAAGIKETVGSGVKLSDYATITTESSTTTVTYTNVYTRSGDAAPFTYTILAANSDKMDYTPAKTTKNNKTDSVDVTNESTKDKLVKATITMSNVGDLTFKATDAYDANEATTSVYFAATDGTTPVVFAKDADDPTKATAEFSVALAKKTGGEDVTYQTTATNAAGGHVYARYEGANSSYTTKAFYLTASANTDAKAKEAWKTWAAGLTATTRPSINIIYDVINDAAGTKVTFHANYDDADPATVEVTTGSDGKATAPSTITRTGWTIAGWYNNEGCTGNAVDLTAVTFSSDTDLYAKWTQDATDDYVMTPSNGGYAYTFVTEPEGEFTALSVDSVDRTGAITAGNAVFADGKLIFNATMTGNVGLDYGNHTITATIGETDYNLTIANPVMTKADGAFSYEFDVAPEGEFTALTVDGGDRTGAITAGNATYEDGVITFNATMTSNIGLATGTHKIDATIGDTVYKLYISN